jgi:hypothetical protein
MPYVKEDLLRSHALYDDVVSIVSAFQFLFTDVDTLAATVSWFERYPSVQHPDDGQDTTPDFTVVFNDDTGLVGEIARFPINEHGVDRLCTQIGRYDGLTHLPGQGGVTQVRRTDVLVIVPFELGTAAVQRIIRDRMLDAGHAYSPAAAPCITQFSKDGGKYVFQRLGDQENGRLREGDRAPGIGEWLLHGSIPVKADRFRDIKAQWKFANDATDPLYLAAHLWIVEFADLSAGRDRVGRYVPLVVDSVKLANDLRQKYGKGTRSEVEAALELLTTAQLAEPAGNRRWRVAWGELVRRNEESSQLSPRKWCSGCRSL